MTPLEKLFLNLDDIRVIDSSIPYSEYFSLDLSASNPELNQLNLSDSSQFEAYLDNYLTKNRARVAYGGYGETRNLYKRSAVFKDATTEGRNIHIGLDLWIKAGTSVLAALDGKVHSFQHNDNLGDYGPTIILAHELNGIIFYTLYGHLSLESITSLEVGGHFAKGKRLGTLGDSTVNGNYAPHLHFQIIKNIGNNFGDYPGVCSQSDLIFYLENCPDPNLLLKIK